MKDLLEPDFLEKLEGLALLGRRRRGSFAGEHRAWRPGTSLEFEDYRDYRAGDDIRYLDWNVWSRLGKHVVKRFSAEEDISVHLLIDASASMGFGTPSKLHLAIRVAAALGYIAWRRMDKVSMASFAGRLGEVSTPAQRRGATTELFRTLSAIESGGPTAFNDSVLRYAESVSRPGLAVVFSDLLDPDGYQKGLAALAYRRFDILMVQILSQDDLEPPGRGALRLVDGETGEERRLRMDRGLAEEYRNQANSFVDEASSYCRSRGIEYLRVGNETPFQDVVLAYLRGGSFLR